jgi:hypothetical protein
LSERPKDDHVLDQANRTRLGQVAAGTLIGVVIIIIAVAASTLVFGAYGWGLFVLTPFVVGFTTGFIVNRQELQSTKTTHGLVLLSAIIGCGGLILFALEGLICLILASPLAAGLAIAGGAVGRRSARIGKGPMGPVYCVALLPPMFALDAFSPSATTILTDESIVIEASARQVWRAVTSEEPIREPATLAGRLGLAYPKRAHFSGRGVGAIRTGYFSTGEAREQITHWTEGRLLAFTVLTQPPSMEEMSPYRHVHAPHVAGYFETGETRFEIERLGEQRSRLTIRAAHRLRIDPVIYWEPIARWAARSNTRRVLSDIEAKAQTALGGVSDERALPLSPWERES